MFIFENFMLKHKVNSDLCIFQQACIFWLLLKANFIKCSKVPKKRIHNLPNSYQKLKRALMQTMHFSLMSLGMAFVDFSINWIRFNPRRGGVLDDLNTGGRGDNQPGFFFQTCRININHPYVVYFCCVIAWNQSPFIVKRNCLAIWFGIKWLSGSFLGVKLVTNMWYTPKFGWNCIHGGPFTIN